MNKPLKSVSDIISKYNKLFPEQWIDSFDWTVGNQQNSYYECQKILDSFREYVFIVLGKSILSGEFIYKNCDSIAEFCDSLQIELIESQDKLCSNIQSLYQDLNNDLIFILKYYRMNIEIVMSKLNSVDNNYLFSAISAMQNIASPYFVILKEIITISLGEYKFSNNDKYIEKLIYTQHQLRDFRSKIPTNIEVYNIIDATNSKITFLLNKISHSSSNRKIEYYLDLVAVSIDNTLTSKEYSDAYKYFKWFISPCEIPLTDVENWQDLCHQRKAKIWQMVLLMRYYTKCTKSQKQIENLIIQFDKYYLTLLHNGKLLPFNRYAIKSVKNYMHNCHLSFLCASGSCVSYDDVLRKIHTIDDIQKETTTSNFYPHKKAVEYLIEEIRNRIKSNGDITEITTMQAILCEKISDLENSIKWCRKNHYYPFQLLWNECNHSDNGLIVFSPSSFCKPINYKEVADDCNKYKLEANAINSEIFMYSERLKTVELKEYVDKSKKSYIEILGLFTAIVTFLISCITIFTNNNANSITLAEKVDHISILGAILLLFVSVGFVLNNNSKEPYNDWKFWFFLATSAIYIFVIIRFAISSAL